MKKHAVTFAAFVSLFLSGCASNLYSNKTEAITALYKVLEDCQKMIPEDARQALNTKAAPINKFDGYKEVDFADTRFPVDEDLPWIRSYREADVLCLTTLDRWTEIHADQAKPLMLNYRVKRQHVYEGLLSKEVSYGVAKRQLTESGTTFARNLTALEKELEFKRNRDTAALVGVGVLLYTIDSKSR